MYSIVFFDDYKLSNETKPFQLVYYCNLIWSNKSNSNGYNTVFENKNSVKLTF